MAKKMIGHKPNAKSPDLSGNGEKKKSRIGSFQGSSAALYEDILSD